MLTIASDFSLELDRVGGFLDLVVRSYGVAKADANGISSRKKFITQAKALRKTITMHPDLSVVAYAGAFLHVCAEYELTIRRLIERYVERAATKCTQYQHLPPAMRDWYPTGCANLLLALKKDKYGHLTSSGIVNSLASTTRNTAYTLVGDAFSQSDWNYRPAIIDDLFSKRLGITKIWQKLSRNAVLQSALRTTNPSTVEQIARSRLENHLQRRNDTIHRGKSYYSPAESEVRDCVSFLKLLTSSLAQIMEQQWNAL